MTIYNNKTRNFLCQVSTQITKSIGGSINGSGRERGSFIDSIKRIFNNNHSFNLHSKKIDSPVNDKFLRKELDSSRKVWEKNKVNTTDSFQRSLIDHWCSESEAFTIQLPPSLSPYKDEHTNLLVRALNLMPKYQGTLFRVDDAPGFMDGKIKEGDTVITKRLLSFSSSLEFVKSFSNERKVFFVLDASSTAHNISKFRPEQAESVVSIDSAFKVNKIITTNKGAIVVHLQEKTHQLGYGDAKNMYTGDSFFSRNEHPVQKSLSVE